MNNITTIEQVKQYYPLMYRDINSPLDVQSRFIMMKNSSNREEYFKILSIIGANYSMIYDSFERKFMIWYEINKLTRKVKGAQINTNGFISERSIVKNSNCVYIKLFYSKTPADALAEYDRLNSK